MPPSAEVSQETLHSKSALLSLETEIPTQIGGSGLKNGNLRHFSLVGQSNTVNRQKKCWLLPLRNSADCNSVTERILSRTIGAETVNVKAGLVEVLFYLLSSFQLQTDFTSWQPKFGFPTEVGKDQRRLPTSVGNTSCSAKLSGDLSLQLTPLPLPPIGSTWSIGI
ncbi:hypothetical protein J6590_076697 [Homalodisca vitripennis]|nr:hypothetical protein J6590_076697 [Homalodisca vitripennis]